MTTALPPKLQHLPKMLSIEGRCHPLADGRVRRIAEEAIPQVQKSVGADRTLQQIRRELDQMEQENQDLKSCLALLEAQKDAA